jgi:hypothetical protein
LASPADSDSSAGQPEAKRRAPQQAPPAAAAEAAAASETTIQAVFNPFGEHRDWCPWVTPAASGGAASAASLCGWQQVVSQLSAVADAKDDGAAADGTPDAIVRFRRLLQQTH